MIVSKLKAATFAVGMTSAAMASGQGVPLGTALGNTVINLPILEGGILTVAVVALVAGIRLVQRKKNRKD